MKQERREPGGNERDQGRGRDPKHEAAELDEPLRRLDSPVGEDSLRGKSDGEILQRYEF